MSIKTILAGNWKMHKTAAETAAYLDVFLPLTSTLSPAIEIVVAPPFTSIPSAAARLRGTRVRLGAQTMHWQLQGAFTGEISAPMLREFGVTHVILGHSERRAYCDETDATVNLKVRTALEQGLTPIVAVGETLEERKAGADRRARRRADARRIRRSSTQRAGRGRHRVRTDLGDRHRRKLRFCRGRSRDGDDPLVSERSRRQRRSSTAAA